MKLPAVLGALIAAIALSGQAPPAKYATGQVWEYRTRPRDAGSMLKIQQVEMMGTRKVYHVSVTGVHFSTPGIAGVLPHIPVSDETLDSSVTRLSTSNRAFPELAVDDGIAEWRRAEGGVFTIPISEIVGIIDDQMAKAQTRSGAESKVSR